MSTFIYIYTYIYMQPKNFLIALFAAEVRPMCSKIPENLPPSKNHNVPSQLQSRHQDILCR